MDAVELPRFCLRAIEKQGAAEVRLQMSTVAPKNRGCCAKTARREWDVWIASLVVNGSSVDGGLLAAGELLHNRVQF